MKIVRFCILVMSAACVLFGQGNTGSILGTVTDPSGAVVPGVAVIVANLTTGVAIPATTNSAGQYAVRSINPGQYTVEATATGFKKFVRQNITLDAGQEVRIDLALETGSVSQSIVVAGQAPLLQTESGTLSTAVDPRQIALLPRRNAQDLAGLLPGMTSTGQNPVANGGTSGKDQIYIDGAPVALQVNTGVAALPNTDMVQDFTVATNSFSAEYGDTTGSVTIATTKSGTNEFHGDLFEYLENTHLNAGNYFTHVTPALHYNQFGGTIGGPIRRNKTFFFFGYQDTRSTSAGVFTNVSVPTDAFKNGNFSSLLGKKIGTDKNGNPVLQGAIYDPLSAQTVNGTVVRTAFPNNIIPASRLSPAALKLQALYPEAQGSSNFANFTNSGANGTFESIWDTRVDHNFSDKDRLMASFNYRSDRFINASPLPNPIANGGNAGQVPWTRPDYAATVNWVHILGPTLMNDMHLDWFQLYSKRDNAGFGQVGAQTFGINGMPDGNQFLGTPTIALTNFTGLGSAQGALWHELQTQRSIVDGLTWTHGSQTLKFGGEIRQIRTDEYQFTPWYFQFNSNFTNQVGFNGTGFDYASFLLGLPSAFQYQVFNGTFKPRASTYSLYAQDDIRVNSKLTVNAGLRWDAPTYYHELLNRSSIFDLQKNQYVQLGVNGMRSTPWNNSFATAGNFGPRVGFAYSPFANSKTVVRGGFGMFTVGNSLSGGTGWLNETPFFSDTDEGRYTSTDNITWKTTLDNIPYSPADKLGANAKSVNVYPSTNKMGYIEQWNLSVSHQFKDIVVQVAYAAGHGVHLPAGYGYSYNSNAIPLSEAASAQGHFVSPYVPYPQYPSGVNIENWNETTNLQQLEAQIEKRFGSGLSFLGAYTFQKPMVCQDGNYRDPAANRNLDCGISGTGNQQRMTLSWVWDLPFGSGRRWLSNSFLRYPFGQWQIDGVGTFLSGPWLNFTTATNTEVIGNNLTRPNLVGDPKLPSGQQSLNEWFNSNAFGMPALYTAGNLGRATMLGPGTEEVDLSIVRSFPFSHNERRYLMFRTDLFNVSNTPAYGAPNTTVGSATLGKITSVGGTRVIQFALKLYF